MCLITEIETYLRQAATAQSGISEKSRIKGLPQSHDDALSPAEGISSEGAPPPFKFSCMISLLYLFLWGMFRIDWAESTYHGLNLLLNKHV